jgi:uncharacterized protein YceK
MFKIVLLFAALVTLAGCAAIEKFTGPTVARTVSKYCETPRDARLALRAEVNKLAVPNSIKVCCKGDPDEMSCTQ